MKHILCCLLILLFHLSQVSTAETTGKEQKTSEKISENNNLPNEQSEEEPENEDDTKTNNKKIDRKVETEKLGLKTPDKLIAEDKFIAIYQGFYGINWLSPDYSYRKLLLVNKTDSVINIKGEFFNKANNEEAKAKANQIAEQKKQVADNVQNAGSAVGGLLGVAAIAGGYAKHKQIDTSRQNLLNKLSNMAPDKPIDIQLQANEEKIIELLIPGGKDIETKFALTYPGKIQNNQVLDDNQKFFYQGVEEAYAKRFLLEPNLYNFAYIDEQQTDKEVGLYFINGEKAQETTKSSQVTLTVKDKQADDSCLRANSLASFSLEDFKTEANSTKGNKPVKNPKTSYRFPGLTSETTFPSEGLRIFVYQNFKGQPIEEEIEFIKLTVNKKENFRTIVNNQIPFSLREIRPGISEFRLTRKVIQPGEYLITLKTGDKDKSYIFSIVKPQK
ncbi:MAG: hypothetical protein SFU25_00395 [Candidatus Caenarcaniphilales bacterium]|nr:hypothetical protein [Candidatus Caenarcaniphilales bacterium]